MNLILFEGCFLSFFFFNLIGRINIRLISIMFIKIVENPVHVISHLVRNPGFVD